MTESFNMNSLISYFEVKILDLGEGQHRSYIGLIRKDTNLRKFPGSTLNSIGFAGNIFHYYFKDAQRSNGLGELKITKIPGRSVKINTVLGMGVNFYKRTFFFTIDG